MSRPELPFLESAKMSFEIGLSLIFGDDTTPSQSCGQPGHKLLMTLLPVSPKLNLSLTSCELLSLVAC